MRNQSRSTRLWGVMVAGLCVLWFTAPAGAVPLESWDNKIQNANARFKVLPDFASEAVLDRETGLVWERSPDAATPTWNAARYDCTFKTTGNRKGWRLPSMPELASLVDPSLRPGPTLPLGHPFVGVLSDFYWSATTREGNTTDAWYVLFTNGEVNTFSKSLDFLHAWCVRGPMNADQY